MDGMEKVISFRKVSYCHTFFFFSGYAFIDYEFTGVA